MFKFKKANVNFRLHVVLNYIILQTQAQSNRSTHKSLLVLA